MNLQINTLDSPTQPISNNPSFGITNLTTIPEEKEDFPVHQNRSFEDLTKSGQKNNNNHHDTGTITIPVPDRPHQYLVNESVKQENQLKFANDNTEGRVESVGVVDVSQGRGQEGKHEYVLISRGPVTGTGGKKLDMKSSQISVNI